jgi:DNA-binding MarR family transcriptional regulator
MAVEVEDLAKIEKARLTKERRAELDNRINAILFYFRDHPLYKLTTLERGADSSALVAMVMRKLVIRRLDLEDLDTWVYELTEKGHEQIAKQIKAEEAESRRQGLNLTLLAA